MKGTKTTAFTIASLLFLLSSNTYTQKVEVTNGITEKMTAYKHLLGNFKPDTFSITVNKQPMKLGETKTFHLSDSKLKVRYDFEYEGHRKGAKIVTFEIPKDMNSLTFTFDWKKKVKLKTKEKKETSKKKNKSNTKNKKNKKKRKKEKTRIFIENLKPINITKVEV